MNYKKDTIIKEIQNLAQEQNFEWLNCYSKPKDELIFKCNLTGAISKTNWSNLKQRKIIPLRNSISYHTKKLESLCKDYNLTLISAYVNYVTKIKYLCNKCSTQYLRMPSDLNKCNKCNNFYRNNKGINKTTVLRNPFVEYKLYFVYIPIYNAYKIGLYKGVYVKSRFNVSVEILNLVKLPLFKAYFLEQFIIAKYQNCKYTGTKFGGYTEAFNNNINKEDVIKIMGASILDVEPRELLESLEVGNQQPSFVEIH